MTSVTGKKESVYRVLVASASEAFNRSLLPWLSDSAYDPVTVVGSAGAAKRMLLERGADLLLINTPLPDETGCRLAASAAADYGLGVLLFVGHEWYGETSAELMQSGVLTLSKPSAKQTVMQAVRLLCASRERLRQLEARNASLEEKLAELRLVSRAKCLLISRYAMTEETAHRYLEKLAMDRCVPKRTVAQEILDGFLQENEKNV